jgi:hypothetical protein
LILNVIQALTTYQNFRLLSMTLFSSFNDPAGILIRGSDLNHAFNAFVRGITAAVQEGVLGGAPNMDRQMRIAAIMGLIDAGSKMNTLGDKYASQFGGRGIWRKMNDALFRRNGMEAWNRAMRISAGGAALDFIHKHLRTPNQHSERYLADELGIDTANKDQYYATEDSADGLQRKGELDLGRRGRRPAQPVPWERAAPVRPHLLRERRQPGRHHADLLPGADRRQLQRHQLGDDLDQDDR